MNCWNNPVTSLYLNNVKHENITFLLQDTQQLRVISENCVYNDSFFSYSAHTSSKIKFQNVTFEATLPVLDNTTAISSRAARLFNVTGLHAYFPSRDSRHSLEIYNSSFTGLYQRLGEDWPHGAVTVLNVKQDSIVKVHIQDSYFGFNERAIDLSIKGDVNVKVVNTEFRNNFGNGSGGAVRVTATLTAGLGSRSTITKLNLNISNSVFRNNFADTSMLYNVTTDQYFQTRSPGSGGAIYVFVIAPSQLSKDGIIIIENSQFYNNTGDVQGGSIFVNPGISTLIQYCDIHNTQLPNMRPKFGDVLYATCNMTLKHSKIFVDSTNGNVPIVSYQAADASNYRLSIENVTLNCPTGHWVDQLNTTSFAQVQGAALETLQVYCRGCQNTEYSLNISSVLLHGKVAHIDNKIICTSCPYGAECNAGILNMDDFWGKELNAVLTESEAGTVTMFQCPQEYCVQSDASSVFYDSCAENRIGTLCGTCGSNFSESLFGTLCISNEKCGWHNWWVALLLGIYGIGYVSFFMFEYDWERFIKWISDKFRKSKDIDVSKDGDDSNVIDNADMSQTGYFQIFMYYIQTAALLKVKIIVTEDDVYTGLYRPQDLLPRFLIDGIKEIFSLDITFLQQDTCFLPNLDVVTKTGIKLLFVGYCFAVLLLMYILSGFCCIFIIPSNRPKIGPITHTARLLMTVLALFLYTYQAIAEDSLLLLNCVNIDGERVLFYDGTVTCLQGWQYYVIALVIIFVIPFFIVLLFGPKVLDKGDIGVTFFFLSCIFPVFLSVPIVLYYFDIIKSKPQKSKLKYKTDNKKDSTEKKNYCCGSVDHIRKEIVDALGGPYRDDIFNGICYEGILNFRRMIMVILFTFITDVLLKQMTLAFSCFVILLIHIKAKPFKQQFSNFVETIALSLLLVISGTNLVKGAFYHSQIIPRGPNYLIVIIFEWVEAVSFGILPIAIMLFIILGMVFRTGARFFRYNRNKYPGNLHYSKWHLPNGYDKQTVYPHAYPNNFNGNEEDSMYSSFRQSNIKIRWRPKYGTMRNGFHGMSGLISSLNSRNDKKRLPRTNDQSIETTSSSMERKSTRYSPIYTSPNNRKRLKRETDKEEGSYDASMFSGMYAPLYYSPNINRKLPRFALGMDTSPKSLNIIENFRSKHSPRNSPHIERKIQRHFNQETGTSPSMFDTLKINDRYRAQYYSPNINKKLRRTQLPSQNGSLEREHPNLQNSPLYDTPNVKRIVLPEQPSTNIANRVSKCLPRTGN